MNPGTRKLGLEEQGAAAWILRINLNSANPSWQSLVRETRARNTGKFVNICAMLQRYVGTLVALRCSVYGRQTRLCNARCTPRR